MKFGDPITNVCVGDKNPHRLCYFVRRKGADIQATDKKGDFWETDKRVIFAGHLSLEKSERLFQPVWEAIYGKPYPHPHKALQQ